MVKYIYKFDKCEATQIGFQNYFKCNTDIS